MVTRAVAITALANSTRRVLITHSCARVGKKDVVGEVPRVWWERYQGRRLDRHER